MSLYLILLIIGVFLGTDILAIGTGAGQITLYRLLSLGSIIPLAYQLVNHKRQLYWPLKDLSGQAAAFYGLWWLYGLLSGIWAWHLGSWIQGIFLLTLGVFSLLALYFWVQTDDLWLKLIKTAWWMISALVVWGYGEIITNIYLLADLNKLDKYHTFNSQPWSRIPITHFANQNDYGTLLLAYLAISLILYQGGRTARQRLLPLIAMFLAAYLMYRTGSRAAFLSSLLFFLIYALLAMPWGFKKRHYAYGILGGTTVVLAFFAAFPNYFQKVLNLFYLAGVRRLTGDEVRVNLLRSGLYYLAETLGFGVGAGNIEYWLKNAPHLPTEGIINMHNWWFEILTAYGLVIFLAYVLMYASLIIYLYRASHNQRLDVVNQRISRVLASFLLTFILASTTSANNMFIEWHWVFFGLILAYVKLSEQKLSRQPRKGVIA